MDVAWTSSLWLAYYNRCGTERPNRNITTSPLHPRHVRRQRHRRRRQRHRRRRRRRRQRRRIVR